MCIYIYIYIHLICLCGSCAADMGDSRGLCRLRKLGENCCSIALHSAKGGAVETGCSDLYGVVYYVTI